jgi:hypothetical protein
MAEGRHSLDRLQRKRRQFTFADVHSAFLLGNLDNTAECLVQQRQRRAQQHDGQQPGVSLGRAFGTRSLDGHRTGFTCRPTGHIETCLLAQVFPCANIDSKHWIAYSTTNEKITKTRPWGGRGDMEIRQHDGGTLLLSFAFFSLSDCCRQCAFDITFAFWKGGCARVGR